MGPRTPHALSLQPLKATSTGSHDSSRLPLTLGSGVFTVDDPFPDPSASLTEAVKPVSDTNSAIFLGSVLAGSYVTSASPLSRLTSKAVTPTVLLSFSLTAATHPPQVMPLMASVVFSPAAEEGAAGTIGAPASRTSSAGISEPSAMRCFMQTSIHLSEQVARVIGKRRGQNDDECDRPQEHLSEPVGLGHFAGIPWATGSGRSSVRQVERQP